VVPVKGLEIFPAQPGNVPGIAPGVKGIGGVGKDRAEGPIGSDGVHRGIVALHLIIDNPGPLKPQDTSMLILLKFKPVALLLENPFIKQGVKNRIPIHRHEIKIILPVGACRRIDGLVGKGKGIQKGLEASLGQHDKGILEGILLGPA